MPNQVRVGVGVTGVAKASSDVDNFRDKFAKLQKEGAKGLAIGAGAAATAKGLSLLDSALSGAINLMGDAVTAAREDEESQTRLRASLVANIPAWNGNTQAIEDTIAARMKLGFSDDEQRKSLALLVVATHDVNKALDIQRGAMDLARLKGISLEEASAALIKVEAGQYRALKALGIVLPANATATQALAAVEKAAAGQAEAYANTNTGKLLVSQVKVGEAMEKVGYVIMPAVATATEAVAAVAVELANDIAGVVSVVSELINELGPFIGLLGSVNDQLGAMGEQVPLVAGAFNLVKTAVTLPIQPLFFLKDRFDDVTSSAKKNREELNKAVAFGMIPFADASIDTAEKTKGSMVTIGTSAKHAATDTTDAFGDMTRAAGKYRKDLLGDANDIVANYYDVLIAKDELSATNAEINALRKIAASRKLTTAETANLHRLEKTQSDLEADLAKHGATQSKEFAATMRSLLSRLEHAHGAEKRAIEAEITRLKLLAIQAKITNGQLLTLNETIGVTIAKGGYVNAAGAGVGHKAAGGPVTAGHAYIVGENHPEVFVPDRDGTILPNAPTSLSGGGSSGGSSMTFAPTVVVQGLATPAVKEAIVRDLGPLFATWLRQNGYR